VHLAFADEAALRDEREAADGEPEQRKEDRDEDRDAAGTAGLFEVVVEGGAPPRFSSPWTGFLAIPRQGQVTCKGDAVLRLRTHIRAAGAALAGPPARLFSFIRRSSMTATAEAMTNDARRRRDGAPAVQVRDLRKEFRRRIRTGKKGHRRMAALDGVTFTIERGECVAILGQNGSGKSTLVRLLSTLLLGDGGTAHVFGYDVFAEPRPVQKLVNRVSVEASFFKKMSAAENLGYAARFYGLMPSQTRKSIPEILERVGFPPDRRNEAMEHLSRGMQQKVALARALLTSPVLLLLDEPTTGLDPRSKLEVQDFIREIRTRHDSTILLCTHDMHEAEMLADRIGILDRGRLLFLERPDEVKERFGVETIEEAFFAATGRTFEDEKTEDDEEREVYA
jgi:ABC-2 type transport system ATP-binding protein